MQSADAPFDICWDDKGIAHIYATTIADAYRGMGYAAGSERLWQIHLSNLFATGTAASVLGPRFVTQDLLHRTFNVGAFDLPDSDGDWIVDAYLEGLNAWVQDLNEIPPEFQRAGTQPRTYTRHDVASRYRFTGWFQHKSWLNKIYLGKLMARHGVDQFRTLVHRFSDDDAAVVGDLRDALLALDPRAANLLFPQANISSGSNNWAVQSQLSASGSPMLAMDPHQGHTIPNTFFYAHLSAPGFDAFGASFPGVPYFMMGMNQHLTWGLTTGMVDNYDVYIERPPAGGFTSTSIDIDVAADSTRHFDIETSAHGPILESLTDSLGLTTAQTRKHVTALHWTMRDLPTSAGVLARLPLAKTSAEFGKYLFEADVSPLVNNIICVDKQNDLRRFVAATLPVRTGVTGAVPLAGWRREHHFKRSTAAQLLVESNPDSGFALTANNDTLAPDHFPLHNFPAHPARAIRITELLNAHEGTFTQNDFEQMQLDLLDVRARQAVPLLVRLLADVDDDELKPARQLLREWDYRATTDSRAASIYYPLLDRHWPITFMHRVLNDDLLLSIPDVAPSLSHLQLSTFLAADSPWRQAHGTLATVITDDLREIVRALISEFDEIPPFGKVQQIRFRHSLARHSPWQHMQVGEDPLGGSATTLAMAAHTVKPVAGAPIRIIVEHGPVFRWVVDLADTSRLRFVISGGNGGRVDSPFSLDHYQQWLHGRYYDVSLRREELNILRTETWPNAQ